MDFSFSQSYVWINAIMENSMFEKAVEALADMIHHVDLRATKVNSTAQKWLKEIPSYKESPLHVLSTLEEYLFFGNESIKHQSNPIIRRKYLQQTIEKIETDSTSVINGLNDMIKRITMQENACIYLVGDVKYMIKVRSHKRLIKHMLKYFKY